MSGGRDTPRSCAECRYDGSWHYATDEQGNITQTRCPNWLAAEQHEQAQELAKLAHENAWAAAQQIMRDVAATMPQFDANVIRDRFDQAGIPTSLRGSAFRWAAEQGLIENAGRRVMSTEATTRHHVDVWRSLSYGRRTA